MEETLLSSSQFSQVCYVCFLIIILLSTQESQAQNASRPSTDPSEVRALNSLFQQWGIRAGPLWNISGEPCSGSAIDGTDVEDPSTNPSIKCDCGFDNNSTCHIIQMRVFNLDVKGFIPDEIGAFPFLLFLKIDQNFFTGPLPASIGNLTALKLLSVAYNSLSGPIPKELGNLRELAVLSLGINNFSGTLPPELGNLVKLRELYIDSLGRIHGGIPSTFGNLQNLQVVLATDVPFSGKIPDLIGNWTKLTTLRLQGNSFEGPIPSTFSKLISLTSLRISDIHNGTSTLDFVLNFKGLTDLVLRNAMISGGIPSQISELRSLKKLDLSFNNLTGQLPTALFNMGSLTDLFLGNNSLSGDLPRQISRNLRVIDLSYNYLSGSFPSWISQNFQVNLVANNFVFSGSNASILPRLNCLQRSFPCNRNQPRFANFSINSGGPPMSTADGMFEAENLTLGAASYHVIPTEKWAVSNVGLFAERSSQTYLQNSLSVITNTDSSELYQTSRLSPSSLRYYGLGLENGPYTITLYFAENEMTKSWEQTWKSLGRRVFDIYIQGKLVLEDFDIAKEAGGLQRAITKTFKANVSNNYIEIHLFWAGKGTCCVPASGYYGPLISALSAKSDFTPSVSGIPLSSSTDTNRTGLIVGLTVPLVFVIVIIIPTIVYCKRKSKNDNDEVLLGLGPRPDTFTYSELKTATDDFSNKLGEGGFGPVYKGTLSDGRLVAVKQLSVTSHQGKRQFATEIATISAVQHRNLVKLQGCCIEGNRRILVYEYLENKSLDQALFGKSFLHLDWPTRFNICLGTARGLMYLHEESRPKIVHRDVKSSNILLDAELCPKISDFGLAKLYDDKKTHMSTRVAGTIGYLAPEYAMRGHLTEKADVFAFGVVALEIVSGRPNADHGQDNNKVYLFDWAWSLYENNESLGLVDPRLASYDEDEALRMIKVAFLCTQASPWTRPSMSRVIAMLNGDIEASTVETRPSYVTDMHFQDISSESVPLPLASSRAVLTEEDIIIEGR